MHEPGPPRTTTVGDSVELAPRAPDPAGAYAWSVTRAPDASSLGDGDRPDRIREGDVSDEGPVLRVGETTREDAPVVHCRPDVPGTYVFALEAPDGVHRQRVRAYPDERHVTTLSAPADEIAAGDDPVERVSVMGAFNDRLLARDRPERRGDEWVLVTRLRPGRHRFSFVVNDDLSGHQHHGVHEVRGPGRPSLSLSGTVEGGDDPTLRVTTDVTRPPDADADPATASDADRDAVDVAFLVDDRDADPDTVRAVEERADGHELVVPIAELPPDVRIHAVPHAERLGAMDTVRVARDAGAHGGGRGVESRPGKHHSGDRTGKPEGENRAGAGVGGSRVRVSDPYTTPEWADSPTVYEVYVRSFAGDTLPTTFREIERRLPHLENLGIDVLWLTPVLASPTEHGYHVTDFYDTAADLGSRAAFESLVDACHEADVRVVFDLVINHTSRDHPAFQLHSAGVDEYADHYRRTSGEFDVTDVDWAELDPGDMPEYYFNWRRIPNLNFDSPTVRAWLLDVVDEWAAVVDGFRCDVAWGVPHGFWKEVADRTPDDVLLLDETIPHDPFYGEGEFGLHYDTSLYDTLTAIGAGDEPANAVRDALDRRTWLGFGPSGGDQLRYVENHDEDRYLAAFGEPAQRAAGAVTFTLPGAPMIYAGQERGNETPRGPMRWHDGDNRLTEFYRELSALRDAEPLLRDGDVAFDGLASDVSVVAGDADRVTAYVRAAESATETDDGTAGGDAARLLVVVNFGDSSATVRVPGEFDRDLFADDEVSADCEVVVGDVAVLA